MAITQVGGHTTDSVAIGSSVSPSIPSGVVAGDVLVASVTNNNGTITAPSGWVKLDGLDASGTTGNAWASEIYYKVAGSSEPSTYTWTNNSGVAPMIASIDAWRGVDPVNPIAGHAAQILGSQSEPHTGPSVTISTATDGLLFYVRAIRFPSSGTVPTLSSTDPTVFRHWSEGIYSGGSVAYAHGQWTETADFSATGTYPGLAVTCSGSESDNFEATFALQGLSVASAGSDTGAADDSVASVKVPVSDSVSAVDVGIHTVPFDNAVFTESAKIGSAHQAVTDDGSFREFAAAGQVGHLSGPRVTTVSFDDRTFRVPSQIDDSNA